MNTRYDSNVTSMAAVIASGMVTGGISDLLEERHRQQIAELALDIANRIYTLNHVRRSEK